MRAPPRPPLAGFHREGHIFDKEKCASPETQPPESDPDCIPRSVPAVCGAHDALMLQHCRPPRLCPDGPIPKGLPSPAGSQSLCPGRNASWVEKTSWFQKDLAAPRMMPWRMLLPEASLLVLSPFPGLFRIAQRRVGGVSQGD